MLQGCFECKNWFSYFPLHNCFPRMCIKNIVGFWTVTIFATNARKTVTLLLQSLLAHLKMHKTHELKSLRLALI